MKLHITAHLQNRHGSEIAISGGYTFTGYGAIPDQDTIKSVLCDCNGINDPREWEFLSLDIYDYNDNE